MHKKVYIRCDASQRRGFGHLRRCFTVADAFKKDGVLPVFLQPHNDVQAISLIQRWGFDVFTFSAKKSYLDEVAEYPIEAKNIFLDLVHRDTLENTPGYAAYVTRLKEDGYTIAMLDGLFEEALRDPSMPELDCIAQPYIGAEEDRRPLCKSWLTGGQYAIIDERYRNLPEREIAENARNILITFGGADPQGITAKAMLALKKIPDMSARVIIGPYFSMEHIAVIESMVNETPALFELVRNETDLVMHYLWADIALGGSGTSRYEFAATGLPAIFVSIYPYHERLSRIFADNGLAIYLGDYETLTLQAWKNAINSLKNNRKTRTFLSENCYKKIDTNGADRLVSHLNRSIFSF